MSANDDLHNCKRDVHLKALESFRNTNDELAGMRPVRGRILLPSCIRIRVSSRAPQVSMRQVKGMRPRTFSLLRKRRRAERKKDEKEEFL